MYHLNDIDVTDKDKINNNLHAVNNSNNTSNTHEIESKNQNASTSPSKTTNLITFGNTEGIAFTAHPPVKVIGFLTRCFGVVSRCTSILLSTTNNEYLLRVTFMMNEDAHDFALFLSTLRHTSNKSNNNKNAAFVNNFMQGDEMYDEMCELFRSSA